MFHDDIFYMKKALELAHQAFRADEVPVGAVVVDPQGTIVGKGYNHIETKKSQLAHAEIIALEEAISVHQDWRLEGYILYVTVEPCMMCFGLAQLSRIKKIVFGAPSPLFGITTLFANKQYANHTCEIKSDILAEDAAFLLQSFFRKKRN